MLLRAVTHTTLFPIKILLISLKSVRILYDQTVATQIKLINSDFRAEMLLFVCFSSSSSSLWKMKIVYFPSVEWKWKWLGQKEQRPLRIDWTSFTTIATWLHYLTLDELTEHMDCSIELQIQMFVCIPTHETVILRMCPTKFPFVYFPSKMALRLFFI